MDLEWKCVFLIAKFAEHNMFTLMSWCVFRNLLVLTRLSLVLTRLSLVFVSGQSRMFANMPGFIMERVRLFVSARCAETIRVTSMFLCVFP